MSIMQSRSTSTKRPILGTIADVNLIILKSCSERLIERNCLASRNSRIARQSSA